MYVCICDLPQHKNSVAQHTTYWHLILNVHCFSKMHFFPPASQMQALQSQLDFQEQSMVEKSLVSRQEAKIRELESKLEFEKTQVKRLEVSI